LSLQGKKKHGTAQEPFKKKKKNHTHGLKQGTNNNSQSFDGRFDGKGLYLKYKTAICKHYELN
jgi:hypothetical protein